MPAAEAGVSKGTIPTPAEQFDRRCPAMTWPNALTPTSDATRRLLRHASGYAVFSSYYLCRSCRSGCSEKTGDRRSALFFPKPQKDAVQWYRYKPPAQRTLHSWCRYMRRAVPHAAGGIWTCQTHAGLALFGSSLLKHLFQS